jgi:translation initiation factor 2 subunit 1
MSNEENNREVQAAMVDENESLKCRYYEPQYPELEEVVMVNVTDIGEMGAYVTLLEYNNIEGMILLSELSRRRIRSIAKLVRVNRTEVVMVLRVDKEKGYIDLSKRRVDPEDCIKCEDRYNKAKAVHSVMRHLAQTHRLNLEYVYSLIAWPMYRKYGHAYDAFKLALSEGDTTVYDAISVSDDVTPEMRVNLLTYIKRRLAPQPVKIRADVEVTCFTYEGIDAIKESLLLAETLGTEESPIRIKLVAPPMYVMTSMTLDKENGIESLTKAIEVVATAIRAKGGSLDVKMAPKAVTQREESELQAMLERLALEQEEVDGDEPED